MANSPGTVDSEYRVEVGIILLNVGAEPFTVSDGDRVAQLVIAPYVHIGWEPVERLDETVREDGAFGHTGTK